MSARCPRGWAGALPRRVTQRLSRALDRPVRVLAAFKPLQAETGPANRDALTTAERLRFNAIAKRH